MMSNRRLPSLRFQLVCIAIISAGVGFYFHHPLVRASSGQQANIELRFGEDVSGTLTEEHFRQIYTFTGDANDVISVTMSPTSGDLDPFLILAAPNGTILAVSDDDGNHTDASIDFTSLPSSGRFFIIATRFGQELGTTSGTYTLFAERSETRTTEKTHLLYGEKALGRISSEAPLAFYFVRAERGDVINIAMNRTSGNLDPHLDLATPDGIILASNDDIPGTSGTLDAAISNYTIPRSGLYLIVATRFGREAGNTEGTYVLSVSQTPPEMLGTQPDNARLIDYGMTLHGTITDDLYQRFYRFDAHRGDVIAVTVEQETGSLDPIVKVLNSDLLPIAEDDNSGQNKDARLVALTLPQEGTYYIVATRHGEAEGLTDGTFSLALNGRPGITNGQALEINYDTSTSGEITDQNVADEYVFIGQQGDVIQVSMERASGDLDPLVTLYDRERKQIAYDDDSGQEKNALLQNYVLPQDGMYIIVASRFDRDLGTTTGTYVLTLELLQANR